MPIFGKKNKKVKTGAYVGGGKKPPSPDSPQHYVQKVGGGGSASPKPSPSSSMQNLAPHSRGGTKRGGDLLSATSSVKDKVSQYEQKGKGVSASYTSLNSRERSIASPPPSSSAATSQHGSHASLLRPDPSHSQAGSSISSVASPASDQVVAPPTHQARSYGFESPPAVTDDASASLVPYDGHELPLPPLQMATVQHRSVVAEKSPQNGGGFGFILRQSYLPVPDDPDQTRLVHLVEPRPDYTGPLMTGDRIIEVNGELVEHEPHDHVVELIKASGDCVDLRVASMPELLELNARVFQGSDNPFANRGNKLRKSTKMKPGQTGTLRKQAAKAKKEFKARSEQEVLSDKEGLEHERVWVVHRGGFSLGTVQPEAQPTNLSSHFSIVRYQGKDTKKVKLDQTNNLIEVDEEDLEKASPASQDTVEDLVDLTHLNEPSVLHVLRQRYGSSLIHTFAGRHLIVLNPLRPLSCYVDRVIDMFRGCRREDMPPHIFAAGQQAYRNMMVTRSDQSLILMGLSGSGKTFNARYLLRYLATIGQTENATVTNAKLDAVELLLHSFGSAATFLNPQATRCTCLYSLDFDPSGSVVSAQVRTFLLEKTRVAYHPEGEGNFNIFYQLIAGADERLTSELMLDALPGEEPNLYMEPHDDDQRIESAAYVWDLIQNCLDILGISEEESLGLWSLLAAIYHLGYAGVKKSSVRGSECFLNPAAAQRAAIILGIDHEDLGKDIFNPPRGASLRLPSLLGSSPSQSSLAHNLSDTGSIHSYGSPIIAAQSGNRSAALDAFVMGLYEQAVSALVMLINRSLSQGPASSKARSSIHVLDTPGFQHRELAGARNGASFDELCMNYAQERLHMLFHDVTFTSEQDRYIQENINWMFSESPESPLPVIDAIDKHVGRRGMSVDLNIDRRGLLWILEEESIFPGASDSSFLDRVHMYHGKPSEMGEPPLIKVMKDENQFQIGHCQRSLSVLYDANGWVKRAREHPSFRIVAQVMADSKKECIGSIFQGRGVAASATNISTSALKVDTAHPSLSRTRSTQGVNLYSSPSSGIKKSSVCLTTKYQLDSLIDLLRKTRQWFIRCILPQIPCKLPGALPSPDPVLQAQSDPAPHGVVNIPLVRAQIQRADIVKAARIYKQGFPEHMSFPEFCRRYGTIETLDVPMNTKDAVQQILMLQEVPSHTYKLGSSQVFLRSGILPKLDKRVEAHTHTSMVQFQARCRGYLGRQRFKQLEVLDSAAYVIQSNVDVWTEIRDWSWWQLYTKIKPMLAIWRVELETKEKQAEIDKLKTKVETLESERDSLQESENRLVDKVKQLTVQTQEAQETANQAEEMLENEQIEKRTLEEQLTDIAAREKEVVQEKEQLNLQIAEMSILARIKQDEGEPDQQEGYMEKYWETKRELETLRQRLSSERDDELETLQSSKRSLDKKLADSEAEVEELNRSVAQLRKKTVKQGQELNDLKLHLESQQARNEELEKRQRKFDSDLSVAKEDAATERQEKEKLVRGKHTLKSDMEELQAQLKEAQEELEKTQQEREDLQGELLQQTSANTESELTSLKRMKREVESKLEVMEDELDEANLKVDNLQQAKARLEVANQTLKAQHQKELEGREEEVGAIKTTMNKKLKTLGDQIEELHEEKQQAVKARRDLERELAQYQGKTGDPEVEKKLKKQVHKYKALLQSANEELERLRDSSKTSALVRNLRNQLDEQQASTQGAVKSLKRVQDELDESVVQVDELTRTKMELESRVSELTREKSDLESRVEEDQDEIEDLTGRQRALISQNTQLQTQLSEVHQQVAELEESNVNLESKLEELNSKMSDIEGGINRQQYEASEVKVRELEQKLDLERSAVRRLENQVQRLRSQLERLHKQEGDDSTQKSSEALRRMQKQLREVRLELQEAERKEQEMARKKRAAESQVQELEVRLQNSEADLKTAERRAETLQEALKVQEEEFGSGEDEEGDMTRSYEDLSSSGDGSYRIGELTGSADDLSDSKDTDHFLSSRLTGLGGGRSTTPRVEDFTSPTHRTRRRRFDLDSKDDEDLKLKSYRRRTSMEDDSPPLSRRSRTKAGSALSDDEEEDKKPRKKYSYLSKYSDEDDELLTSPSRRRRNPRDSLSPSKRVSDEEERTTPRRTRISDDEEKEGDEDLASWRRGRNRRTRLSDSEEEKTVSPPPRARGSREKSTPLSPLSPPADADDARRKRFQLSDEEEDKTKSVSPSSRVNGGAATSSATGAGAGGLTNGTKTSSSSLGGEKTTPAAADEEEMGKKRKESIKNLVSKEQEQLYSVAQNRRRRRRTGDAKSTRQTAQNNGSAV